MAPFIDTSDVLVYSDSDCRHSDNWMEDILSRVLSGRADLAYGDTVALEDGTMMGKMSALGWLFPVRSPNDPLLRKGVLHCRAHADHAARCPARVPLAAASPAAGVPPPPPHSSP